MAIEIKPLLHNVQWTHRKKILTLFLIVYLFLYIFPFPLGEIPGISVAISYYQESLYSAFLWIGTNILQIKNLDQLSASGIDTIEYVKIFSLLLIALAITTLAFFLDRKRANYNILYYLIIGYARYYVGLTILIYGFMKIFGGQFGFPTLKLFETPFGSLSAPQLFWAFMGYSKVYGTFIAISEITGGFLLLFSRTKLIGSILVIIIMANVLLLDIAFLSSVIIFSSHLLLIAIIILYPHLKRIIDFLIFNKTEALENVDYVFQNKRLRFGKAILKSLVIISYTYLIVYPNVDKLFVKKTDPPLYGVYQIKKFHIGQDSSIMASDSIRWRRLIIDKRSSFITTMTDFTSIYKTSIDTIKKTLNIISAKDTSDKYHFTYSQIADSSLIIRGNWKGKDVFINAKKKSIQEYFLINRKPKNVMVEF